MAIFSHELGLALTGQLQATINAADAAVLKAANGAVDWVIHTMKDELREMVEGARLGRRLANSVRGRKYPDQGLGRDPAGFIYVQPSAVHIYESFATGATIRSRTGDYLAIPVPGSPADRKNYGQKRDGRTTIEDFKARGIELAFVRANGSRPAMLVGKSVRLSTLKSGRQRVTAAKLTKSGRLAAGTQSIPLFWLVPSAKMPKRLAWDAWFRRASEQFMQRFAAEFDRRIAEMQDVRMAA